MVSVQKFDRAARWNQGASAETCGEESDGQRVESSSRNGRFLGREHRTRVGGCGRRSNTRTREVHFGWIFPICGEKNSELADDDPLRKFKVAWCSKVTMYLTNRGRQRSSTTWAVHPRRWKVRGRQIFSGAHLETTLCSPTHRVLIVRPSCLEQKLGHAFLRKLAQPHGVNSNGQS